MSRLTRRQFLGVSAATTGSLLLPSPADASSAAQTSFPLHKRIGEAATVCPYCSCGCGLIIALDEQGHVSNVEGDPENPINRGVLDPKSLSVRQLSNSPLRLNTVLYRAPGAIEWEEKTWDWAMAQIADRVKKTRDATFVRSVMAGGKQVTVNRTEGIAWLGGAANNNEDCYLAVKLMRTLGVVYLEHQARI
jgi:formate dehydrogenase major subunit